MDQGSTSRRKPRGQGSGDGLPKLAVRAVFGATKKEQRRRYAAFVLTALVLLSATLTFRASTAWTRDEAASHASRPETGGTLVAHGPGVVGDTLTMRIWRGRTGAGSFTAYPCNPTGSLAWLTLKYDEGQRTRVRALPTQVPLTCPTARILVREVTETHITGKLLELDGVKPVRAKEELPPGVDLGSFDAIEALGAEAVGKVGWVPFYRGITTDDRFIAYPCHGRTGDTFLPMSFTDDQRPVVRGVPASPRDSCRPLRFQVTDFHAETGVFEAKLVGIESALLD